MRSIYMICLMFIISFITAESFAQSDVVNLAGTNLLLLADQTRPVADAGADQDVYTGDTVFLDGNGSTDPNDDPLTYAWLLTDVPAGSNALLIGATTPTPSFIADLEGNYTIQLVVNDGSEYSLSDTVTVTAVLPPAPPIADAGTDQDVYTGDTVFLDGNGSSDPNDDPLTYAWSFTAVPSGSNAVLGGETTATPSFTADLEGSYTVQLIVNDGSADSPPDTVTVTATDPPVPPIADAGPDQDVYVGDTVHLDGTNSSDPNGDQITYAWSFTSVPYGISLVGSTSSTPYFIASEEGTYTVQLIVNDGSADSPPDTVTVTTRREIYIPDTGQTADTTATFGEDSDYTITPQSYTVNGDGTTTDNVTGLMWQSNDNVSSSYPYFLHYNWYYATGTFHSQYNSANESVCGDLTLGGYSDWRLPARGELLTLLRLEESDTSPYIDNTAFPGMPPSQSGSFWTRTTSAADPLKAWYVQFVGGQSGPNGYKEDFFRVRCVRYPTYNNDHLYGPIFVDNTTYTVTDQASGLMWKKAEVSYKNWEDALAYCEGLNRAGYDDWRLPNYKELASLVDVTRSDPAINTTYFTGATATSEYWTSSTAYYTSAAWKLNASGGSLSYTLKTNTKSVLCVR